MPPSQVTARNRGLSAHEQRLIEVIATAAEQGQTLTREEAGTLAGYGKGNVARAAASRAISRPHVRQALLERAAEAVAADAVHAAYVLRHVRSARGRDALPAAVETLKLAGLGARDEASSGPGVVLNLVLPDGLASLLPQARAVPSQVIENAEDHDAPIAPSKGAARSKAPRDPSPGPKRKPKQKAPGGQKRRAKSGARVSREISGEKSNVSPGDTDV